MSKAEDLQEENRLISRLMARLKSEGNRAGSYGRKKRLAGSLALSSALFLSNRRQLEEINREESNR
jgi:hypothetical protein